MTKAEDIKFAKLLGFEALSEVSGPIDFQDDVIDAKLGAKVGKPEMAPVTLAAAKIKPAS